MTAQPQLRPPDTGSADQLDLSGPVRRAYQLLQQGQPDLCPCADEAEDLLRRAAEVVACNRLAGRLMLRMPGGVLTLEDGQRLTDYCGRVLVGLRTEGTRLALLKDGDAEAWETVRMRLERLAFFALCKDGARDWAAEQACEVAAHTYEDLWLWLQVHHFPFDVPFDVWSARALSNRLREGTRQRRTVEKHEVDSLDRTLDDSPASTTVGETVADTRSGDGYERLATREALLQAIAGLPPLQAQVLRLWYLELWETEAIARHLNMRAGTVYVYRLRGLARLKTIVRSEPRFGLTDGLPVVKSRASAAEVRQPGKDDRYDV